MRNFIRFFARFSSSPSSFSSFWVCGGSLCALSFQRGLSVFDGIQLLAKCSGGPFICIAKQSVEWFEYGEIQQVFYFLYSKTLLLLLVNVLTRSCLWSTGRPQRVTKAKCLDIQVNARTRRGRFGYSVLRIGSCEPVKVVKPQRSTLFLLRGVYGLVVWRSFQGNHKDSHKHVIWTTWLELVDQQKVSLISQLVLMASRFSIHAYIC